MTTSFTFDIAGVCEDDMDAWTRPFSVMYQGQKYHLYLSYDPQFDYQWYTPSGELPTELQEDLDTMDLSELDEATWQWRESAAQTAPNSNLSLEVVPTQDPRLTSPATQSWDVTLTNTTTGIAMSYAFFGGGAVGPPTLEQVIEELEQDASAVGVSWASWADLNGYCEEDKNARARFLLSRTLGEQYLAVLCNGETVPTCDVCGQIQGENLGGVADSTTDFSLRCRTRTLESRHPTTRMR